jgi:GH18 family chitinase
VYLELWLGHHQQRRPPASFARVAYFEAWNPTRPYLHMDVTDIDKTKFTHIHFAFRDITPDYKIDISKT